MLKDGQVEKARVPFGFCMQPTTAANYDQIFIYKELDKKEIWQILQIGLFW